MKKAGLFIRVSTEDQDYTNQLFQDATYAKVPRNPEDIMMSALPQIEMAWDLFSKEAPKALMDYLDRGVYEADFEEKYREDINFYNFLNTSMKTLFFTQGKALPFLKDVQQITKGFYNFYGVDKTNKNIQIQLYKNLVNLNSLERRITKDSEWEFINDI